MSEHQAERQHDLIAELRRTDAAFAGLKPGRDDVMDRLLAGDTDELVAQSERRLAGRRRFQFLAGAVTAAVVVVVMAVAPARSPVPVASVTSPPSRSSPSSSPSLPPSALPAVVATSSVPVVVPAPAVVSPVPAPSLRRLRPLASGAAGSFVVDGADLAPISLPPAPGLAPLTPTGVDGAVVGVASPVTAPPPGDDEVESALREARSLSTRGDFGAAADVLGALLARQPSARVVDAVAVQRATLLARAGRRDEACAALQAHRARFPASDNAVVVAAELDRSSCR